MTDLVEEAKILAGASLGGTIAYGLSAYLKAQANAAVKVRPKLAEVGWVDALLTNHLADWLFYQHGEIMTAVLSVLGFTVFGGWLYANRGEQV